jgi:hypothetical protein
LRRQENVSNLGSDGKENEEEACKKKNNGKKRKIRSPYLTYLIAVLRQSGAATELWMRALSSGEA